MTATTTAAPAGMAGHPERGSKDATVPPELEFLGLTATDCPVDCTADRCVISGSAVFRNDDGTTTLTACCGHPNKGALSPIQQINSVIVKRHNRARKFLAMEIAGRRADRGDPQ